MHNYTKNKPNKKSICIVVHNFITSGQGQCDLSSRFLISKNNSPDFYLKANKFQNQISFKNVLIHINLKI